MWGNGHGSHYRILVSRARQRPSGELYPLKVCQPIPNFLFAAAGHGEPLVELNRILHDLYERAGYDLRINPAAPRRHRSRGGRGLGESAAARRGWTALVKDAKANPLPLPLQVASQPCFFSHLYPAAPPPPRKSSARSPRCTHTSRPRRNSSGSCSAGSAGGCTACPTRSAIGRCHTAR